MDALEVRALILVGERHAEFNVHSLVLGIMFKCAVPLLQRLWALSLICALYTALLVKIQTPTLLDDDPSRATTASQVDN